MLCCVIANLVKTIKTADESQSSRRVPSKVTGSLLPQEYDLSRFIGGIENPLGSWNSDVPACDWTGIRCDEQKAVTGIYWLARDLKGVLNWQYIPSTIEDFFAAGNQFSGHLPFEVLPSTLRNFCAGRNELTGTPNFCTLSGLYGITINDNLFTGHVDFDLLPVSLKKLFAQFNAGLEGTLDLNRGPSALFYDVRGTEITVSNGEPYFFQGSYNPTRYS